MYKITSAYIMVYSRHYVLDYDEVETIQEGIDSLESGSDSGLWFPIAVVEITTKKIVWNYDNIITDKVENQRLVDKLLNELKANGAIC